MPQPWTSQEPTVRPSRNAGPTPAHFSPSLGEVTGIASKGSTGQRDLREDSLTVSDGLPPLPSPPAPGPLGGWVSAGRPACRGSWGVTSYLLITRPLSQHRAGPLLPSQGQSSSIHMNHQISPNVQSVPWCLNVRVEKALPSPWGREAYGFRAWQRPSSLQPLSR